MSAIKNDGIEGPNRLKIRIIFSDILLLFDAANTPMGRAIIIEIIKDNKAKYKVAGNLDKIS